MLRLARRTQQRQETHTEFNAIKLKFIKANNNNYNEALVTGVCNCVNTVNAWIMLSVKYKIKQYKRKEYTELGARLRDRPWAGRFKGIVHLKMKIKLSSTHPQFLSPQNFLGASQQNSGAVFS